MCFTCFLGFFGSVGVSFSLPFSVDDFLGVSFGFSVASAGLSVAGLSVDGLSVVSSGFSTEPSVVSSYIWYCGITLVLYTRCVLCVRMCVRCVHVCVWCV